MFCGPVRESVCSALAVRLGAGLRYWVKSHRHKSQLSALLFPVLHVKTCLRATQSTPIASGNKQPHILYVRTKALFALTVIPKLWARGRTRSHETHLRARKMINRSGKKTKHISATRAVCTQVFVFQTFL